MTRNGVLLMTYGSPASLVRSDIAEYLERVRGGRAAEPDLIDEFTRRYQVIGGSPLIDITTRQAAALERTLDRPVAIGMRFSQPSIESGLRSLRARDIEHVAAIVLSPQFSPLLMGGYERAITTAVNTLGMPAAAVTVAGAWHREPAFIEALGRRVAERLTALGDDGSLPVLFTAHSLPRHVADREPEYLHQLRETASLVARHAGLGEDRWRFCWQSAGHEPGEWMTPDFGHLMPLLAREGHRSVLVAPVQFLADHLETLYDVDVGAREQAEAAGLMFSRIESLNDDPDFIAALAAVSVRTLENVGLPVASG